MKIKKIKVDKIPDACGNCKFCLHYYDDEHEEYFYQCIVNGKTLSDTEVKIKECDIFEK